MCIYVVCMDVCVHIYDVHGEVRKQLWAVGSLFHISAGSRDEVLKLSV